jgi:hypothetical protein
MADISADKNHERQSSHSPNGGPYKVCKTFIRRFNSDPRLQQNKNILAENKRFSVDFQLWKVDADLPPTEAFLSPEVAQRWPADPAVPGMRNESARASKGRIELCRTVLALSSGVNHETGGSLPARFDDKQIAARRRDQF